VVRVLTRRAGELERAGVMVSEHLGDVVGPLGERLDPLGRTAVLLRPLGTGDLAVRNIPDEHVAEGVLHLAADRRPALAADELLPLERMEKRLQPLTADSEQGARPKDLPQHGRVLEHRLLFRWESIEA